MPIRPINRKPKETEESKMSRAMWKFAEKNSVIEQGETVTVFELSDKEAKKCRYEIIDNNARMAECTVHRGDFSHGVRVHPPHLWDIVNGKIFHNVNGEWKEWTADVKQNRTRFNSDT